MSDDSAPRHVDVASDRAEALAALRQVREEGLRKSLGNGRIRDEQKEKVRVRYLKVVVSACNAERRLLRDRDLDALAGEVDALKAHLAGDDDTADAAASDVLADGSGGP